MEFGIDDEAALHRAVDQLSRRLPTWQSQRRPDHPTWPAEQALHFKWGYLDGHLGRWTVADLHEILLELFPRKVSVPQDAWPDVPIGILVLLEFLADQRLLADDGHPSPASRTRWPG